MNITELKICEATMSLSEMLVITFKISTDEYSETDIKELTDVLLRQPVQLIDPDGNVFKIIEDTICIGRNSPNYSDYETFISFDTIDIGLKEIKDVDRWIKYLSNSKLEIKL